MSPSFVSEFLLPLVSGGSVHVGPPLGDRDLARLMDAWVHGGGDAGGAGQRRMRAATTATADEHERVAAAGLAWQRGRHARALLPDAPAPQLDEATLRIGITVHNLLALGHPDLAGRALVARQERIVAATAPIAAALGAPTTASEAVNRHSLLARLPEITRTEYTVEFWAGRRHFIGRRPPHRWLAMGGARRVSTRVVRRAWWKEIGIPGCARGLWIALFTASPLGEALDPLRLDPAPAWERIMPVLRHPDLCRAVAARVVEVGVPSAGGALAVALLRFASLRARQGDASGRTPADVAFAIRFIAHACWMDHVWGAPRRQAPAADLDLAALMAAADDTDPRLVWPPDVPRSGDIGQSFRARLDGLRGQVMARAADRYAAMAVVCRLAVAGAAASATATVAASAPSPPPL